MHDGPLDMRFDPTAPLTAADLVNTWDQRSLADIIYRYGEERKSRQVAAAIIAARPINSTRQLAELVAGVVGNPPGSKAHPATRTFQALRIAVNGELDSLERFLAQFLALLKPGGRVAVIAYHSLEDRMVKQTFRSLEPQCVCPPQQPRCTCGEPGRLAPLERKAVRPSPEEIAVNPRARSARLRVGRKLNGGESR